MIDLLNTLRFNKVLDTKKIFLIALIALFILYMDFSFIFKPQIRGIGIIGPKIIKLDKDISVLNKDLAALQDLQRSGLEVKKQEESSKSKKIIYEEKMPSLLQDLSDMANNNSIKIMQIKPSKDTKLKEEVIAGVKILPIIITLELSCGYHSLGAFINALENSAQYMAVQEMKITSDPNDYLYQKVNLVLKTYVKK